MTLNLKRELAERLGANAIRDSASMEAVILERVKKAMTAAERRAARGRS